MIPRFLENKIQSDFLKHILTLLSGSVLAQLIVVAVSPILTRIYEPEVFGSSALFLSITGILSTLATGRYEMAIVQTKKDYDGISLVLASVFLTLFFSFLLYLIYFLIKDTQYILNLNKQLSGYILFIPILVISTVIFKSLTNYFNRNKYYKTIASNQIALSSLQSIGKLSIGFLKLSQNGLILGAVIGQFLTATLIVVKYYKYYFDIKKVIIAYRRLKYNMAEYKDFPKILLFSDGINVVAYQLPFILTSYFFSLKDLGYLSFAFAMSSMPLTFIGTSISSVFRQKMSEEYNKKGSCDKTYKIILQKMFFIITIPFIIIFFFAPNIFEVVFGENWYKAGKIVQILILMFYFQFFTKIFNYLYILTNHQKEILYIQSVLLIGVLLIFTLGSILLHEFYSVLIIFSIFYSGIYIFTLQQSYKYSKGTKV